MKRLRICYDQIRDYYRSGVSSIKKEIEVTVRREVQSLAADIGYKTVGDWFNGTLRTLTMDSILPKHREGHAPQPVIVWLCGGGFTQVNEHIWLPEMVRYAQAGITVVSPRYRTANEAPYPAQLQDVKAAIRFVRANAGMFCADPERIFVIVSSSSCMPNWSAEYCRTFSRRSRSGNRSG